MKVYEPVPLRVLLQFLPCSGRSSHHSAWQICFIILKKSFPALRNVKITNDLKRSENLKQLKNKLIPRLKYKFSTPYEIKSNAILYCRPLLFQTMIFVRSDSQS